MKKLCQICKRPLDYKNPIGINKDINGKPKLCLFNCKCGGTYATKIEMKKYACHV